MKMLLGYNQENEILFFGEYEVRNNNEFSASFDQVGLIEVTNEMLINRAINILGSADFDFIKAEADNFTNLEIQENDFDLADKIEVIAKAWVDNYYSGIENFIDISLYPDYFFLDGKDFYFESWGCGQLDLKDYDITFIYPDFAKLLLSLWEKYHLKEIPQKELDKLNNLYNEYYSLDNFIEYDYIENLIKKWRDING